ncbi:MAG: glutamine synthetase adenylyltransferase, partial [Planctomycetaceae bacterium]
MSSPFHSLLAESDSSNREAESILNDIGFENSQTALKRFQTLGQIGGKTAVADCLPMLCAMLRDAPSPDVSLLNFERFVGSASDPSELCEYLAQVPRGIEILVRLFVGSQFLTEILIRNPHYLRELTVHQRIADFKNRQAFLAEASGKIAASNADDPMDVLRRFQRWELLRIGACDAFGLMDLRSITQQLSLLADAVVQTTLDVIATDMQLDVSDFAVVALGKLGGKELNYSSDIDLIFLSRSEPQKFWQLGQKFINALTVTTQEGFLYRVDMRLRPWGQSGALVNSVEAHLDYLSKNGELWEKQALLKARSIAGNSEVGQSFIDQSAGIVYGARAEDVRLDVLQSKEKIESEHQEWGDVKSGKGSLRDIEFTTQYLQLVNGRDLRDVRSPNTLQALVRLADFGFLHADEYRILTDAYGLFRTIEHSLQLVQSQQTHRLPSSDRKLGWLARRMAFLDADQLRSHFNESTTQVRRIFDKYVRAGGSAGESRLSSPCVETTHRRKMGKSYTDVFSESQIADHAQRLDEVSSERPVIVSVDSSADDDATWQLTVIGRDQPGCLSIISGLMVAHGIDVLDGHVFTGIKTESTPGRARRFVNTFRVRHVGETDVADVFEAYETELVSAMSLACDDQHDEAAASVLRLVSQRAVRASVPLKDTMPSVEIEVDNVSSEDFTILHIESADSIGFLYELTNALTLSGVHIEQVQLRTIENRVFDTLHVTHRNGSKITADRSLQELRAAIVLIKHFTHLLPKSPSPRRALRQFREFLSELFKRDDWVEDLSSLQRSEVLDALAQLLGVSNFLWMDFLRLQHENLFPVVRDVADLKEPKPKQQLCTELHRELADASEAEERRRLLNAFKDREMFRVDMRHILDHCNSFTRFAAELTDVADVVLQAGMDFCVAELAAKYGLPQTADGKPCRISVCALGKCGGRELGFASDIELMFIYESDGRTSGEKSISNSSFVEKLVSRFSKSIEAREDGI